MDTASCQARTEEIVDVVDGFSKLPHDIAHNILSLISFKDLTRVGCVSKRCRGFCLSTPYLNFLKFSGVNLSTCDMRKRVLDSFDWFLIQRGDNKIKCFRFCWSNHSVEGDLYDAFFIKTCYCGDENLRVS